MPKTNKSIATFAVLAAAGLLIATMFVFVAPIRPLQSAQAVVQEPPAESGGDSISLQVLEAGSFVQQTGKSAVKAEFASKEVSVARGNTVTVQARIQHVGGANAESAVNVKVLPPVGYILYPPSLAKSTTLEERVQAAETGNLIAGSIDLGQLVTVVGSNQKAIEKAGEQVFQIQISVPKDLSDEMVGSGFHIPLIVQATDNSGNLVFTDSTGIDVTVTQ